MVAAVTGKLKRKINDAVVITGVAGIALVMAATPFAALFAVVYLVRLAWTLGGL